MLLYHNSVFSKIFGLTYISYYGQNIFLCLYVSCCNFLHRVSTNNVTLTLVYPKFLKRVNMTRYRRYVRWFFYVMKALINIIYNFLLLCFPSIRVESTSVCVCLRKRNNWGLPVRSDTLRVPWTNLSAKPLPSIADCQLFPLTSG